MRESLEERALQLIGPRGSASLERCIPRIAPENVNTGRPSSLASRRSRRSSGPLSTASLAVREVVDSRSLLRRSLQRFSWSDSLPRSRPFGVPPPTLLHLRFLPRSIGFLHSRKFRARSCVDLSSPLPPRRASWILHQHFLFRNLLTIYFPSSLFCATVRSMRRAYPSLRNAQLSYQF